MKLYLSDESIICVRPSGTEPKVKFYIGVVGETNKGLEDKVKAIYENIKKVLKLD